MTDATTLPVDLQVSLIIGTLLPLLVSVVVRSKWSSWLKGLVVLATSIVAGLLSAWAQHKLTDNWAANTLVILILAIGTYKLFWQPTGIGPAIEKATQPQDSKKE